MAMMPEKDPREMTDEELIAMLKKRGPVDPESEIGPCPCCGRPIWQGLGEICYICNWEQELFARLGEDEWTDANGCTLRQWRAFYASGRRKDTPEDHKLWWDEHLKTHPEDAD